MLVASEPLAHFIVGLPLIIGLATWGITIVLPYIIVRLMGWHARYIVKILKPEYAVGGKLVEGMVVSIPWLFNGFNMRLCVDINSKYTDPIIGTIYHTTTKHPRKIFVWKWETVQVPEISD